MTRDDYLAWERRMGFDQYGGAQKAADALGVSPATIRRFRAGDFDYSVTLRLAMTALALDLKPWPVKP